MATLTDFRANVATILGLENTATADQPEIDRYTNEAVREILLLTRCYITSTTVTSISVNDYTLTTAILSIRKMYFTSGGSDYGLTPKPLDEIVDMRLNSSTVGPARYYHFAGKDLIMFYPTPAAADLLTLYYVPYPTEMTVGSHDPSTSTYGGIPKEQHRLIEMYACWKMAVVMDDGPSQLGKRFQDDFERGIGQFRKDLSRRGGDQLSAIPLPSRRRGRSVVPRPDQVGTIGF